METYRVRTTISKDGQLTIAGIPFRAGAQVEVTERGFSEEAINEQISALVRSAEWVVVPEEKIEALLSDPDDNVVVACAVEGGANYLVTYDPHFDSLQGEYRGVKIVKAIPFLEVLRGNV